MEAGETSRHGPPGLAQSSGSESPGRPAGRSAIYSIELEVFEGPLDLLLHLVRRHELEILDIPIAFITEKYLEYLDLMRSLDLEVAGDYLVMAATLAYLKSRELLPSDPLPSEGGDGDDEDAEDPREALIRRLVEYERFKNAAQDLDALPVSGRDVFARGADIDIPATDPGLAPVTLFRLAEAYYRVLTRAKINKSHEVQLEPVTVAQRMTQLTLMLDQKQSFDFEGLFLGRTWTSERELRGMLVVTLMSILELVKLGVARVQQPHDSESIRIYRLEVTEEARAQIDAYDESESFGDAGRPPKPPPLPTEAELDAAEESALLAEALAGADDTDLGPDAGQGPAANSPAPPVDAAHADEEQLDEPNEAEQAETDAESNEDAALAESDEADDDDAELAASDDTDEEAPELAASDDAERESNEDAELAALLAEELAAERAALGDAKDKEPAEAEADHAAADGAERESTEDTELAALLAEELAAERAALDNARDKEPAEAEADHAATDDAERESNEDAELDALLAEELAAERAAQDTEPSEVEEPTAAAEGETADSDRDRSSTATPDVHETPADSGQEDEA